MQDQRGAVPIAVIIALALGLVGGGVLGFVIGDGSLLTFGIGFGLVLVLFPLLRPIVMTLTKALRKIHG